MGQLALILSALQYENATTILNTREGQKALVCWLENTKVSVKHTHNTL